MGRSAGAGRKRKIRMKKRGAKSRVRNPLRMAAAAGRRRARKTRRR